MDLQAGSGGLPPKRCRNQVKRPGAGVLWSIRIRMPGVPGVAGAVPGMARSGRCRRQPALVCPLGPGHGVESRPALALHGAHQALMARAIRTALTMGAAGLGASSAGHRLCAQAARAELLAVTNDIRAQRWRQGLRDRIQGELCAYQQLVAWWRRQRQQTALGGWLRAGRGRSARRLTARTGPCSVRQVWRIWIVYRAPAYNHVCPAGSLDRGPLWRLMGASACRWMPAAAAAWSWRVLLAAAYALVQRVGACLRNARSACWP